MPAWRQPPPQTLRQRRESDHASTEFIGGVEQVFFHPTLIQPLLETLAICWIVKIIADNTVVDRQHFNLDHHPF